MKQKISIISVIVNIVLFIGKVFVGYLTNSTAVLAEGIDSGTDIISSLISSFGIKIASKPVDERHPYGHYKFEVLSGLLITIILFLTGGSIIYKAYYQLTSPSEVNVGYLSLGVMAFTAIVNEIMARLKIKYGKKENSVSLISDGLHSRVDVWRSIAVFFGLILTDYWSEADQVIAILVGLYILKESFSLGKEVTDSLLDVSADKEDEEKIRKIVKKHNLTLSDLKTQKKGYIITANLKIQLPPEIKLDKATDIIDDLKKELIDKIDKLEYVAVQIESKKGEEITSSYFKSKEGLLRGFGGFGWRKKRKGKFQEIIDNAEGKGPAGFCVCPECGYREEHKRGVPCTEKECPQCGTKLTRK